MRGEEEGMSGKTVLSQKVASPGSMNPGMIFFVVCVGLRLKPMCVSGEWGVSRCGSRLERWVGKRLVRYVGAALWSTTVPCSSSNIAGGSFMHMELRKWPNQGSEHTDVQTKTQENLGPPPYLVLTRGSAREA